MNIVVVFLVFVYFEALAFFFGLGKQASDTIFVYNGKIRPTNTIFQWFQLQNYNKNNKASFVIYHSLM